MLHTTYTPVDCDMNISLRLLRCHGIMLQNLDTNIFIKAHDYIICMTAVQRTVTKNTKVSGHPILMAWGGSMLNMLHVQTMACPS